MIGKVVFLFVSCLLPKFGVCPNFVYFRCSFPPKEVEKREKGKA